MTNIIRSIECDLHLFLTAEPMDPASAKRSLNVPIFFLVVLTKLPVRTSCENSSKELVLIKPNADVKYFAFPTSDDPIVTWMDIQKGIYPNTSSIGSTLEVGEPITIFIYLKDSSKLFDIMVTDCWAYDDQDFQKSKYKLHLTEEHARRKQKLIDKWYKHDNPKGSGLKCFLYADLASFKFPDKEQLFLKCDIQLCFKSCDRPTKKIT